MNIIDYQNRSIKIYIKQQKLSGFLNPFSRHRAANRPISSQLVAQAANAAKLRQQHSHHIQMGFWNTDIFMAHLVNKRPHILFSIILIPWACQPGQRVCVCLCVKWITSFQIILGEDVPKHWGPIIPHPSGSSGSQGVHIIHHFTLEH